jgi:hypothetical protein
MGHEGYIITKKEKESSFRDDVLWKELYTSHIGHLRKTYRGINAEGESVTEDSLHSEASEMADVQYKMKMKQIALEKKLQRAELISAHEEEQALTESKKKLLQQKEEGNRFAERALNLLDEDK